MPQRRLYLFRHGQTDWNVEGRIQGHIDVPLNEHGRAQARALVRPLGKLEIQAILSSDLSRAADTARIIAEALGIPVFTDPGLREIHLGKAQGLTRHELVEKFGDRFGFHLHSAPLSDADVAFLGSERSEEVSERAIAAVERFLREHGFDRVGVASHGGVIRRLIAHGDPLGRFPGPVPNGTLFPVNHDGGSWETLDFNYFSR